MEGPIILVRSGNPAWMSFLLAMLKGGEGIAADLQNFTTGVWRLTVRADQAAEARLALREVRVASGPA
jgi:hypothetical protein